jgi:hypothetical protein
MPTFDPTKGGALQVLVLTLVEGLLDEAGEDVRMTSVGIG